MVSYAAADKVSSGPRPYSFSGVGTAGDACSTQTQAQRPIASRFVEGSMNDRLSRAPPVAFLSASAPTDPAELQTSQDEQHGFGFNFTRRSLQMARPSFSSFRAGSGTNTTSNTTSSIATTNTTATISTTASSDTPRRPRSFLAPFWEGMTKRLHRRARSAVESDMAQVRADADGDISMEDAPVHPPQSTALPDFSDRPSPDEIFANYQKLMQAGFFTKRAIAATRPGLSGEHMNMAGATTPANTPAPSCPDRFPPSPPRPAFLSNGTPLSPVAPSPTSTPVPMATTPRGTKRIHADVDNNNENRLDKDSRDDAFQNVAIIAASEAPLSPSRTPRKISNKLRKSSSRLPGGASLRTVAACEHTDSSDGGSMASRVTRSSLLLQNVQVHQTQPPLPVPRSIFAVPVPRIDRDGGVAVSESTGCNGVATKHNERRPMDATVVEVNGPEDTQEPRKKRRSQGPAVVHQVQQQSGFGRDGSPSVVDYHRPLGPRSPGPLNRGSSSSRRTPRRPMLSTFSIVPPATPAADEQAPISFHYPQRVRVRQPMQAQIVEVKASPAGKGRTRAGNASASADGVLPLQNQATSGHQSRPVTRSRAKNARLSAATAENAENAIPRWED